MILDRVVRMYEMTEEAAVAASADVVWADLTDADALAEWIWPPRFETTAVVDPHPGGAWELRSELAELAVIGRVVDAAAPRSLRVEWQWEGEEQTSDVEIALVPDGDRLTRVTVRHSGLATSEERDSHIEGWSNCLGRLVERHAAA